MTVTAASMLDWTRHILGVGGFPDLSLEDYLGQIPTLDSLAGLPAGTVVLVRGDVDAKPGATVGDGDIRLRSMKETLDFGRQHGFKQVVFGHIGREPEKSLAKVAARLAEILGCDVPLITGWLDPATNTIKDEVVARIKALPNGAIVMLENTRAYDIERVLWKAKEADLPGLAPALAAFANEFATKLGTTYVHEAFSAGSLDASSVAIPAAMQRVALGKYAHEQFAGPMMVCMRAQLVVFSGLKADKLDDMEAIIRRGHVKKLFVAGALAMSLKKADAQLAGGDFCIGKAQDPANVKGPTFVPEFRLAQAREMLASGRQQGIEFVLPVDFRLLDHRYVTELKPDEEQGDVGSQTIELFAKKVGEFIDEFRAGKYGAQAVAFHNGVFGMFEKEPFHEATAAFMAQLRRMKDAGIEVYVGGGEGGTALEKYGGGSAGATHCFTAGGTVLNALGSDPIPFLVALRLAAQR